MEASTPQEMLNAELREAEAMRAKRRRVDEPEPEIPLDPEIPPEMQLDLVEAVEAAQREADPVISSKLVEASRIWRSLYEVWKSGKGRKMETPPPYVSLALARLFVSPRFKLVSEMTWPVKRAILLAYNLKDMYYSGSYSVLAIARVPGSTRWSLALLNRRDSRDRDLENFVSFSGYSIKYRGFNRTTSKQATIKLFRDSRIKIKRTFGGGSSVFPRDFLIYGNVKSLSEFSEANYDTLSVFERLFFAVPGSRGATNPPTTAMLGWKDKIAIINVTESALTAGSPGPKVTMFYENSKSRPHEAIRELSIETHPTLSWEKSLGDLKEEVFQLALANIRAHPGVHMEMLVVMQSLYMRFEVEWHTGKKFEFFDSRKRDDPSGGYALPKESAAVTALAEEFARQGEPHLKPIFAHPEWGYVGDMFIPRSPRTAASGGLLIMPAPWYFYAASGNHIKLSRGLFQYNWRQVSFFALPSPHILAHQPHELIYLPDDLNPAELADLALLQRRDISERATSRAPSSRGQLL